MSADKTERYVLSTPAGEYVLDGTFRPDRLAPTGRAPRLVRAYGYRDVYDLHDGLADAGPLTLTGTLECSTEDELALELRELRTAARAATAITRNDRVPVPLRRAWLDSAPVGDDSNVAQVTLTLIPAEVPDEGSGIYDW